MSTNDFGADFAGDIVDYFTDGQNLAAPPATVYVTLYDDLGNELNGDLQNGRVGLSIPGDWQDAADATQFENAIEVNFGEATTDITVQEFAIKDADDTDANATEYFRGDVTNAPQDFANGTRVFFSIGELTVNLLDNTND